VHESVYLWGTGVVDRYDLADQSVIEIGAANQNGSLRPLFTGPFLATDIVDGPGVEVYPRDIEAGPVEFMVRPAVILCTEVLEHLKRPWLAMANMRASVRHGAHLILTCRGYDERGCWPVHHHPIDVWRFSALGLRVLCEDAGWTPDEIEDDPEGPGFFVLATAL